MPLLFASEYATKSLYMSLKYGIAASFLNTSLNASPPISSIRRGYAPLSEALEPVDWLELAPLLDSTMDQEK